MRSQSTGLAGVETGFRRRSAMAVFGLSLALAGCSSGVAFDDPFAEYLQRTILVSTTGGESQAANTAIETATPWPRYANNTSIPANGARMAKAIQRYESGAASDSATQAPNSASQNGMNPGSTGISTSQPVTPPSQ
jgi:hypothetical protein